MKLNLYVKLSKKRLIIRMIGGELLCYFQSIKELYCTLEDADDEELVIAPASFVHKPPNGLSTNRLPLDSTSDVSADKRCHAGLELAQCKAKLRRLRHEL